MRTLDYLNLNEARVANVVTALQNLLADFQIYYTNLRGFHWEIKGRGFFVLHEIHVICSTTVISGTS